MRTVSSPHAHPRRRGAWPLLPALVLLATSCAPPSVQAFQLAPVTPPARPANAPVSIYTGDRRPECPVEEIAVLEADGGAYGLWSDSTAAAIRRRVRKMGGDAVVGLEEHGRSHGTTIRRDSTAFLSSSRTSLTLEANTERWLRGTIVRFTNPECQH